MNGKKQQLDDIFNMAARSTGSSAEELKKAAAADPKLSSVLSGLSAEDLSKISAIITDREATARILATPKARELLKKLKKNP